MIQFNLLPDVKLEYVRAQRVKHTVISASLIAAGSAILIFLLLFATVHIVQKKSMNDLNSDISKYDGQLKATPDLDKILTIQSQLSALPALHAGKAAASRNFSFIQQLVPSTITLTDLTTDYTANTFTLTGESASLDNVNTLVDTLKYTTYADQTSSNQKAFTDVVLSQFTRSATTTTFTVTANFAPAIFDNASNVKLTIPSGVSSPSVVGQPTTFKEPTTTTTPASATTTTNGSKQ
jgi:Tfp pilus assembly protein PilN